MRATVSSKKRKGETYCLLPDKVTPAKPAPKVVLSAGERILNSERLELVVSERMGRIIASERVLKEGGLQAFAVETLIARTRIKDKECSAAPSKYRIV